MDPIIREGCKLFTAGLADNNAYMMEMVEAKPKFEAKENNLFLIDIRPEASYKAGHIPGSVNFPLAVIVDKINDIPKNRPIFVVCTLDAMSAYATMILRLLEFPAIFAMGGVPAYKAAGGTLETS